MKSILLVRVSTLSQDYTAQKEDLIKYSKLLGVTEYHIIEDKESAIKLTEEERNGLNQMKEWITDHPDYKSVIVWEISRLARSEKVLHSIKQYFLDNRIQLYIYDKKYKLLNDDGTENQETSLLFSLYAYFAESEMKIKKERFRRSRKLNSELGKYNGGAIKFGYTLNKDNYVVPDPTTSKIVKDIFLMYATGKFSLSQINLELRQKGYIFSNSYISSLLSFTGYTGRTDYDDVRDSHRNYIPLVSQELYDRVQFTKIKNMNCLSKSKRYYLGAKLIKCPICGCYYIYTSSIYSCINNTRYNTCDYNTSINSHWMDILLWYISSINHKIYLSIDRDNKVDSLFNDIRKLLKKTIFIQNEINKTKKKYDRINMLFIDMKIDQKKYDQMEGSVSNEIKEKEEEIKRINAEIESKQITLEQIESGNLKKSISSRITLKEMSDIVHQYIKEVKIYRDNEPKHQRLRLEIKYNKYFSDGSSNIITEDYYYYPRSKKMKLTFNGEYIDQTIYDECGRTIDTIRNDVRPLLLVFYFHLLMDLMMAFYTECH